MEEYVTIAEAARILDISQPTVRKLIARGMLTVERNPLYVKGPVKIPRAEVEALSQLRRGQSGSPPV